MAKKQKNYLNRESKLNLIFLAFLGFITVYPFLYLVSVSFSDAAIMNKSPVILLPKGFSLDAYEKVVQDEKLWRGFFNSINIMVGEVLISLCCTMMMAYPLALRGGFTKYSNIMMKMVMVSMYFSGGMIPLFLVVKELGMINTYWSLVIPGAVSSYHLIIARSYIRDSIPNEIYDASSIDGANEAVTFTRIVLPLSMPIVSVLILYRAVGSWNSFFSPLLYLNNSNKYPLQIYLRELLLEGEMTDYREAERVTRASFSSMSLKAAVLVVSTLPVLIAYPFLQKYFIKGMMIGAVKG